MSAIPLTFADGVTDASYPLSSMGLIAGVEQEFEGVYLSSDSVTDMEVSLAMYDVPTPQALSQTVWVTLSITTANATFPGSVSGLPAGVSYTQVDSRTGRLSIASGTVIPSRQGALTATDYSSRRNEIVAASDGNYLRCIVPLTVDSSTPNAALNIDLDVTDTSSVAIPPSSDTLSIAIHNLAASEGRLAISYAYLTSAPVQQYASRLDGGSSTPYLWTVPRSLYVSFLLVPADTVSPTVYKYARITGMSPVFPLLGGMTMKHYEVVKIDVGGGNEYLFVRYKMKVDAGTAPLFQTQVNFTYNYALNNWELGGGGLPGYVFGYISGVDRTSDLEMLTTRPSTGVSADATDGAGHAVTTYFDSFVSLVPSQTPASPMNVDYRFPLPFLAILNLDAADTYDARKGTIGMEWRPNPNLSGYTFSERNGGNELLTVTGSLISCPHHTIFPSFPIYMPLYANLPGATSTETFLITQSIAYTAAHAFRYDSGNPMPFSSSPTASVTNIVTDGATVLPFVADSVTTSGTPGTSVPLAYDSSGVKIANTGLYSFGIVADDSNVGLFEELYNLGTGHTVSFDLTINFPASSGSVGLNYNFSNVAMGTTDTINPGDTFYTPQVDLSAFVAQELNKLHRDVGAVSVIVSGFFFRDNGVAVGPAVESVTILGNLELLLPLAVYPNNAGTVTGATTYVGTQQYISRNLSVPRPTVLANTAFYDPVTLSGSTAVTSVIADDQAYAMSSTFQLYLDGTIMGGIAAGTTSSQDTYFVFQPSLGTSTTIPYDETPQLTFSYTSASSTRASASAYDTVFLTDVVQTVTAPPALPTFTFDSYVPVHITTNAVVTGSIDSSWTYGNGVITLELYGQDDATVPTEAALTVSVNGTTPVNLGGEFSTGWVAVDVPLNQVPDTDFTITLAVRTIGAQTATYSDGTILCRVAATQTDLVTYAAPTTQSSVTIDTVGFFARSITIEGSDTVGTLNPLYPTYGGDLRGTFEFDEQEMVEKFSSVYGISSGVQTVAITMTVHCTADSPSLGPDTTTTVHNYLVDFDNPPTDLTPVVGSFILPSSAMASNVSFKTSSIVYEFETVSLNYAIGAFSFSQPHTVAFTTEIGAEVYIDGQDTPGSAPTSLVAEVYRRTTSVNALRPRISTAPSSSSLHRQLGSTTVKLYNNVAGNSPGGRDIILADMVGPDGSGGTTTGVLAVGTVTFATLGADTETDLAFEAFAAGIGGAATGFTGTTSASNDVLHFEWPNTVDIGTGPATLPLAAAGAPASGVTQIHLVPYPLALTLSDPGGPPSYDLDLDTVGAAYADTLFTPASAEQLALQVTSVPSGITLSSGGGTTFSLYHEPGQAVPTLDPSTIVGSRSSVDVTVTTTAAAVGVAFDWDANPATPSRLYALTSTSDTLPGLNYTASVSLAIDAIRSGAAHGSQLYFAAGDPQAVTLTVTVTNEADFLAITGLGSLPGSMVVTDVTATDADTLAAYDIDTDGAGTLLPSPFTVTQTGTPTVYTGTFNLAAVRGVPAGTPVKAVVIGATQVQANGVDLEQTPVNSSDIWASYTVAVDLSSGGATEIPLLRDVAVTPQDGITFTGAGDPASFVDPSILALQIDVDVTPLQATVSSDVIRAVTVDPGDTAQNSVSTAQAAGDLSLYSRDGAMWTGVQDNAASLVPLTQGATYTAAMTNTTPAESFTAVYTRSGGDTTEVLHGTVTLANSPASFLSPSITLLGASSSGSIGATSADLTVRMYGSRALTAASGSYFTLRMTMPVGVTLEASVPLGVPYAFGAVTATAVGTRSDFDLQFTDLTGNPTETVFTIPVDIDGSYVNEDTASAEVPSSAPTVLDVLDPTGTAPIVGLAPGTTTVALSSAPITVKVLSGYAMFLQSTASTLSSFLQPSTISMEIGVNAGALLAIIGGTEIPPTFNFDVAVIDASAYSISGTSLTAPQTKVITGTLDATHMFYVLGFTVSNVVPLDLDNPFYTLQPTSSVLLIDFDPVLGRVPVDTSEAVVDAVQTIVEDTIVSYQTAPPDAPAAASYAKPPPDAVDFITIVSELLSIGTAEAALALDKLRTRYQQSPNGEYFGSIIRWAPLVQAQNRNVV